MGRSKLYMKSKFDGLPVSVLEIVPDCKPSAVIYLIHGLCGCKERFLPFMEYLASEGIACVASDLRGHGSSLLDDEDRGYMYGGGAEAVVADIDTVVDYIHKRFDDRKLFLLGHSMGSLAARAYVKYHDDRVDGLVVCGSPSPNALAPLAYLALKYWSLLGGGRVRVGYLQRLISDRYNRQFRHEGPQAWTCSDAVVRKAYAGDPRCNFMITADCAATLLELFLVVYSSRGWNPHKLGMPITFLSGEDDPCMISHEKFDKSVDSMRANGYTAVTSHTYPGMRHEILNEINKKSVWIDILTFCIIE